MITVSIFGIVILIFVLHTILTHLLNWFIRSCGNSESVALLVVILNIMEIGICIGLLNYYIS